MKKKLTNYFSFIKGIARLSDKYGKLDSMEQKNDSEQIADDWAKTGEDIKTAIIKYPEEKNEKCTT